MISFPAPLPRVILAWGRSCVPSLFRTLVCPAPSRLSNLRQDRAPTRRPLMYIQPLLFCHSFRFGQTSLALALTANLVTSHTPISIHLSIPISLTKLAYSEKGLLRPILLPVFFFVYVLVWASGLSLSPLPRCPENTNVILAIGSPRGTIQFDSIEARKDYFQIPTTFEVYLIILRCVLR